MPLGFCAASNASTKAISNIQICNIAEAFMLVTGRALWKNKIRKKGNNGSSSVVLYKVHNTDTRLNKINLFQKRYELIK